MAKEVKTTAQSPACDRTTPAAFSGQEVEYPIALPIKVVGLNRPTYPQAVLGICAEHGQHLTAEDLTHRPSSAGNYLSLTFPFQAESRTHLEDFYRAIEAHPLVKWCL